MNEHPRAAAIAAAVAGRDSTRLAAAVTDTVRLRALLPGGPIEGPRPRRRRRPLRRMVRRHGHRRPGGRRPARQWPTGC